MSPVVARLTPERMHRVVDILDPEKVTLVLAPEDIERLLDDAYRDGWDLVASIEGVFPAIGQRTTVRRPLLILRRSSSFVAGTRSAMVDRLANGATVVDVVRRAAEAFGVRPIDVLSRPFKRTPNITRARHVAAHVLRSTGMSYPEIGTALAQMDHTSAMHACRRVEREPDLLTVARSIAPVQTEVQTKAAEEDE